MLAPEPVSFAAGPAGVAYVGLVWLSGLRAGCSSPPADLAGPGLRANQPAQKTGTSGGKGPRLGLHEPAPVALAASIGYRECVRLFTLEEGSQG